MKTVSSTRAPARRPSPHIAAVLSFLWPGLGHLYARRERAAAAFALPVLAIALAIAVSAAQGLAHLAVLLITPSSALTILVLVVLIGVWRLVSIADSMLGLGVRSPWREGSTGATFATLAAIVVLTHLVMAYFAWAFYDAGSRIFTGDNGPDRTMAPSAAPGATSQPTEAIAPTPHVTPSSPTARINTLLIGIDSAGRRTTTLTDTLMVVSVDPVSGDVAMISFPRDLAGFELPNGEIYTAKINSLYTHARTHPEEYPQGPIPAVMDSLSHLLGAPIHYYAAIDLEGFRRMVDLVGGVTVDNPRAINDPLYLWLEKQKPGFFLSAGVHTLDGRTALAYVRSRQGAGDSDFSRARRQQQVLLALRDKLTRPEMITQLPALLDAAADSVTTNFPSDRVGEMVELATRTSQAGVTQVVLGPPYAQRPENSGTYFLRLDMERMAKLSIEIFGDDSRYAGN